MGYMGLLRRDYNHKSIVIHYVLWQLGVATEVLFWTAVNEPVCRGYMEQYWGYIEITEKKMETTRV